MSTKRDNFTSKDKRFMKLALDLARARKGLTGDNPSVGCVIVKKNKITTITVTHDMESVYEFSDYTAFIKNGKISWYGNSKNIKKQGNSSLIKFINGVS